MARATRHGAAAMLLVAGLAHSWIVYAAEPARAQRAKAELLRRSAQKNLQDGQFEKAIAALKEAESLVPDPKNLHDIANAYDEWGGHCAASLEAFQQFFAACKDCPSLSTAKNDVLLVQNRCASDVSFETTPAGATIRIEHEDFARITPFVTQLRPGRYRLEIKRFGHVAKTETIEVAPVTPLKFQTKLERAAGISDRDLEMPPAPADDRVFDDLPIPEPEQSTPEQITTPAPIAHSPPTTLTLAALGLGIAGGITGTVFTLVAIHDVDQEREARFAPARDPGEIDSRRSAATRDAVLASAGFGASLLGFAGAAILYFIEEPRSSATVKASPGAAALELEF